MREIQLWRRVSGNGSNLWPDTQIFVPAAKTQVYEGHFTYLDGLTDHWLLNCHGYAYRIVSERKGGRKVFMQRDVADFMGWPSGTIDHIDTNQRLNNHYLNLRNADWSQNQANSKLRRDSTTGFKNISRSHNKFTVQFKRAGKFLYRAYFDTLEEADGAAKAARLKYHGEFARDK